MNRRNVWLCLAGLALAAVLELVCAGYYAGRGYGGPAFEVEEYGIQDFEVENDHWTAVGAWPSMVFRNAEKWGHLELVFAEPLAGDISVECYYSPEGDEAMERFRRSEVYLIKGSDEAALSLPPGGWKNIHLVIHGDFVLESLKAAMAVPVSEWTPGLVMGRIRLWRLAVLWLSVWAGLQFLAGIFARRAGTAAAGAEQAGRAPVPRTVQAGNASAHPAAQAGPRIVYMDAVRTLAVFLVIAVHVVEPVMLLFPMGTKERTLTTGAYLASMTCNPIFVMISGALLLPYRDESLSAFLKKRLWKILLPLLVYAVFYVRLLCVSRVSFLSWVVNYLNMAVSNHIVKGPHLWMVYMLLGLYLLVVPVRYMLRAIPEQLEKYLAALILIFLAIRTLAYYRLSMFGISLFLDDWPGIFLLGYLITRPWMRKYDLPLVLAGAAVFPAAVWIGVTRYDFRDIVCNQSIFMVLMACAVLVVCLRGERFLKPFARIFAMGSRYSYSILLIHWLLLSNVIYHGIFNSGMPRLVQVAGPIVLCFVLSLLCSMVVDHTLVAAAEGIAERAACAVRTFCRRGIRSEQNVNE